jgi:uncharacterized repeat protein (TIGR01451 family)
MSTIRKQILLIVMLVGIMSVLLPLSAIAAPIGTPAGTQIGNTATLNYQVGGVAQNMISAMSTTLVVDNKINVVVTTIDSSAVSVAPGATQQVLTFTVTNMGNNTQDYHLLFDQKAGGAGKFGGTDNYDVINVSIHVKNGAGSTYNPATDTATYIDELASGSTATVFIVADMPNTVVDTNIASLDLIAQTAVGGTPGTLGADITTDDSGSAKIAGTVMKVFIDAAGTATGDVAKDGKHSAQDDYKVVSAQLSVTKSAATIWDPAYYNSNPKAIPGGAIQYTIQISNASAAGNSATLTTISDVLNANLAMDPDLKVAANAAWASLAPASAAGKGFKVTVTGSTRASFASPKYFTTATDSDGVDYSGGIGGTITANMATILPVEAGYTAGQLKPNETVTLIYNVIIQ